MLLAAVLFSGCAFPKKTGLPPKVNQTETSTSSKENPTRQLPAPQEETPSVLPERIPILMYHYVRTVDKNKDPLGYNLSMEPAEFEKQIGWLQDNGYQSAVTGDILRKTLPEKPVILSFDDGYADFYSTAFPILEKYGFTAEIAVIVGKISQPGYMTADQIMEMKENGIQIDSHTLNHPDLTKTSPEQLKKELAESKNFLENMSGAPVKTLVYPSGKYDKAVLDAAAGAGYTASLTTEPGFADLKNSFLVLKRVRIDNRDNLENFIKKISGS